MAKGGRPRNGQPSRNPQHVQNYMLQRDYGISLEQRNCMIRSQDGRCAICQTVMVYDTGNRKLKKNQACVDHDHATGKIRGILCHSCNLILGRAGDSVSFLRSAAEYLEKHNGS